MQWKTAHAETKIILVQPKEVTANKKGKTELVPGGTNVHGRQPIQKKTRDEGNLGLGLKDQGGEREIRKRKRTQKEVLEVDLSLEVDQTPQ